MKRLRWINLPQEFSSVCKPLVQMVYAAKGKEFILRLIVA
jgi:hypothetical protein